MANHRKWSDVNVRQVAYRARVAAERQRCHELLNRLDRVVIARQGLRGHTPIDTLAIVVSELERETGITG